MEIVGEKKNITETTTTTTTTNNNNNLTNTTTIIQTQQGDMNEIIQIKENNKESKEISNSSSSSSSSSNININNNINNKEVINEQTQEYIELRDPLTRPLHRLSVKLIDTYKHINKVYYEAKAKRLREQQGSNRVGLYNDGYDDQNYDYIIHGDEMFAERYILKHRIGKGSFGQVVCAYDRQTQTDVAIKIIKSKHAFMVQARTEIKLLELTLNKDKGDEQNIVRLLDTFVYRKHQCLVFEMLSYNLYELLKNTKFRGVSLSLVRKFAKQILKGLEFLAREDVDIIHCDLKPENILLRHPKRSAIKIIDFGSSCLSTKKTYTYIQSRFYRSPEVLLGLPYSQKIDIWSLGCVLVEMHTGEPLFGGVDQLDQLNRIVNVMGMLPPEMIAASPPETRSIFFEKLDPINPSTSPANTSSSITTTASTNDVAISTTPQPHPDRIVTIIDPVTNQPVRLALKMHKSEVEAINRKKDTFRKRTLEEIVGVETGGPQGRRRDDPIGHSSEMYTMFVDFIRSMLIYQPSARTTATDALKHAYIHCVDQQTNSSETDSKQSATTTTTTATTTTPNNNNNNNTTTTTTNNNDSQSTTEKLNTDNKESSVTLPSNQIVSDQSPPRRRSLSAPRLTSTGSGSITTTTTSTSTNNNNTSNTNNNSNLTNTTQQHDATTIKSSNQSLVNNLSDQSTSTSTNHDNEDLNLRKVWNSVVGLNSSSSTTVPSSSGTCS